MIAHALLTDQGAAVHAYNPADHDDGDPENGPGCWGFPAFDVYSTDSHDIVVNHNGLIDGMSLIDWDEFRYLEKEGML
jgi:hypothetical protein